MHSKKHKSHMSIIEFQKKYDTEDKCREELLKMRYPKGFKCSKCECTEYYYLKSRGKYQCKNCKHQSSVTSGTVILNDPTKMVHRSTKPIKISKKKKIFDTVNMHLHNKREVCQHIISWQRL